jgi:hypothetical protein
MTLPIESGRITVGTTPVQIDGVGVSPIRIYVHNEDNTKTIFIGGSNVTIANGFGLNKLESKDFLLFPNQSLWVVSDSSGHTISYLRIPV